MTSATLRSALPGVSDCERLAAGALAQPVNTYSSIAYVVVGVAVLGLARPPGRWRTPSSILAACLVATGVGSVAYHGPQPANAELMHDLPIVALLTLMAVHDAHLLRPRLPRPVATWTCLTLIVTGASVIAPVAASLAADLLVVVIVAAEILIHRRRLRPRARAAQRRWLATMAVVLSVAGASFALGRTGSPICDPDSLLQPHALWHVASAVAFGVWWRLALTADPLPDQAEGPGTRPHLDDADR